MKELVWNIAMHAVFFNLVGYIIYCLYMKNKKIKPNATSWGLWAFIATADFFSYEAMSGNMMASLTFLIDAVACVGIFIYIFVKDKVKMPKFREWVIVAFVVFAMIIWWVFQNATWANLIVCFASFLSFFPIIESVWKDRKSEKSEVWFVQTLAYFFMLMSILISKDFVRVDLVAPIMLMLLHLLVAVIASTKKKLPRDDDSSAILFIHSLCIDSERAFTYT